MATTQANRAVRLDSPFGKDVLLLRSLTGTERLNTPFRFDLELASGRGDLDPDAILGKSVCIGFPIAGERRRFLHGYVTEFAQAGYDERFHEYRATVRPWLWFLSRAADCRIFQNKTVPEIFEAVAKGYGINNYELKLRGSYPRLEYCVQYRESDLDFVSRLLEHEGIAYFFTHAEDGHVMVLTDEASAHPELPGYATVPYFAPGASEAQRSRDHLSEWTFVKSVRTGTFVTTDFDFEKPSNSLLGNASVSRPHVRSELEVYDYPAGLASYETRETNRIAKVRLEELQASYMVAHGRGDAAGLASGCRFRLENYPRADLNIEYLVIGTELTLSSEELASGAEGGGPQVAVAVEAIDCRIPFRPPRRTPRPVMRGAQTAVVVGPPDKEIFTDKYGRVKVQFHWDREGRRDDKSSCWIRVAQLWAGKGWGAVQLPRIGQEVVVEFLEGDPDRPLVTGRLYNGESMPPYALPANMTQSGIKSRSTKQGTEENFNEIRFEDKKDSEEIYIHAEKDMRIVVENDQTIHVGKDKKDKGDRTVEIHNDDVLKVGNDRKTDVVKDATLTVGGNRTERIDKDDTADVGKKYRLTAGDSITFETGQAKIVMKKNGDITISGKKITLEASAEVDASATKKISLDAMQVKVSGTQIGVEGTKTAVKGTMLDLAGDAVASLKGGITKIG